MRGRRAKIASRSRTSLERSSAAHSSRAHSRRPERGQAPLQLGGELEQVHDVLARVGELLGESGRASQRVKLALLGTRTPSSCAAASRRSLCGHAGEAGGDLGVEDVADLGAEAPAQQRDVLAAGVHDELDRGVGEQLGERRSVELLAQRVDQLDAQTVVSSATRAGPGTAACGSGPRP